MEEVIEIITSLEDSGLLTKRAIQTIERITNKQNNGFLGMLLSMSGASLLRSISAGTLEQAKIQKAIRTNDEAIWPGDYIIQAGKETIWSEQNV